MLSSFHLAFDQSPHMATNLKPNTAVIPQSCVGTLKYNVPLIFLRMLLPRGFPKEQLPISTTVFFSVSSSTSPTSSSSSSSASSSNASSVAHSTASQLHHHLRVRQLHHLHHLYHVLWSHTKHLQHPVLQLLLEKTSASDMNRYNTWSVTWRECPMTQNGCTANSVTWKHPASLQTLVSSAWKPMSTLPRKLKC